MRILVGVVSGIIFSIWKALIQIIVIVHFVIVLFGGKRNKDLAEFCETWNTQVYVFLKYMTFVSNRRPFPFNPVEKSISRFGR